MKFEPAGLDGAYLLGLDPHEDERGFFARLWCASEFRERGLADRLDQCSVSFNRRAGTLRGLHFQAPPHQEDKVVRCIRGAIFDVMVDLRPSSPAFKQWIGRELSNENRLAFYVPAGFAHGFQTLTDDAEVLYLVSEAYVPALARGVRWDDPSFGIRWPLAPSVISDRDRTYPDFER